MSGDATTGTVATTTTATARGWGARSIAALLIFCLATILMPIALIGHWGQRTVIDSERYLATVGPLINEPEVQAGLADAVTKAVVAKADTENQVSGLLEKLFPNTPITGQLAAPIASGINGLIGDLVTKFIASDQFATVWIQLNQAAQKGVVAVLEGGDSGPVQIKGPDVVLDISSALAVIQKHLVDSGITAAANVTIPANDRQIVLYSSPAIQQVRFIYALTAPILQWLPLLVAAMFALAVALARRRARTTVATGIVVTVWGFLLTIGLAIGQGAFKSQLSGTPFGPASDVFWQTLLEYLIIGIQAVIVLGIVLIIAGWFGGRTKLALAVRRPMVKGLNELGSKMSGVAGLGAFARDYRDYLYWVIYAIALLLLVFAGLFTVSTVLWIAALVAGLVTVVQLLVGAASAGPSSTTTAIPSEGVATTA
jgi:hypothetical protein